MRMTFLLLSLLFAAAPTAAQTQARPQVRSDETGNSRRTNVVKTAVPGSDKTVPSNCIEASTTSPPLSSGALRTCAAFSGNGGRPAQFGYNIAYNTSQAARGNIGLSLTLNNVSRPAGADNYGVGLFVLGNALPGAGDTWGGNIASYVQASVSPQTNHFALELNQNISNRHYGDVPMKFTATDKEFVAAPLNIVGAAGTGLYRGTAAIMVQGTGGQAFNRGIAFAGDSIKIATIQDTTNTGTFALVSGSHNYGVDFSRVTGMASALVVPNTARVTWKRADDSSVDAYAAADNRLHVAGQAALVVHSSVLASADGAFSNGSPNERWSQVSTHGLLTNARVVTAGASAVLGNADYLVVIRKTKPSATTVTLPPAPQPGQILVIKDGGGNAVTYPVTVNGGTIDGAKTYIINAPFGALRLQFDGAQWVIV